MSIYALMEYSPALIRIVIIVVGLVLAVVGMLSYTELIALSLPRAVMFVGWGLIIAGIVSGYFWDDYEVPADDEESEAD